MFGMKVKGLKNFN